jgi:hypothetical protein
VRSCSLPGVSTLPPAAILDDALVGAYLHRLGVPRASVDGANAGTLAALRTLQRAHIDRVCYENLDTQCGADFWPDAPPLDPRISAARVVSGRGGYCFVIVDAYGALLRRYARRRHAASGHQCTQCTQCAQYTSLMLPSCVLVLLLPAWASECPCTRHRAVGCRTTARPLPLRSGGATMQSCWCTYRRHGPRTTTPPAPPPARRPPARRPPTRRPPTRRQPPLNPSACAPPLRGNGLCRT